jgi:hypothetical protein
MEATMKTRITIDESGLQLPVVERLMEDMIVTSKKIHVADLHKSMIAVADEWMLYDAVFGDETNAERAVERMFEYLDNEGLGRGDKFYLALANLLKKNEYAKPGQLVEVFRALCEVVNVAKLDSIAYANVVRGMVSRLDAITDTEALQSMMLSLLEKTHFFDSPEVELLEKVLTVIQAKVKEFDAGDELDIELVTPVLPKHCVFYKAGKGNQTVAIEFERSRIDVNLNNQMISQVGHPKLLFVFTVGSRSISASVSAIKDEVITGKTKLYRYPFSNVYNHAGCCWSVPQVKDVRNLESFPIMFLQGIRNFDLYPKTGGFEYRELLQHCTEQDFNDDLLEDTGKTVADIM